VKKKPGKSKRGSRISVVDLESTYGKAFDIAPYAMPPSPPRIRGEPMTAIIIDDIADFERSVLHNTLLVEATRPRSVLLDAITESVNREKARQSLHFAPEFPPLMTLDSLTKDFQLPFFPEVERPVLPAELRYKKILALVAVTKMKVRV
jgi:hypothetical protein